MDLIVDGLIYTLQKRGGISRIYNEILPRMCELDANLEVFLLVSGRLKQPLPSHRRIHPCILPRIERSLRSGSIPDPLRPAATWAASAIRRWYFPRERVAPAPGAVWHSTYYSPAQGWRGASVVWVHDMIHERFPELFAGTIHDEFRRGKRECVLAADAVMAVSSSTRGDLESFYGIAPGRVEVVPPASSRAFRRMDDPPSGLELPTRKPFLLLVGPRHPHKNIELFLRAYERWPRATDVDVIFVSRPWKRREKEQLLSPSLRDRVHLVGNVGDEGLCWLYNKAAAFVHPSLYEGFGIPLLEAMACGCPVVASRIPSTVEVAADSPYYFDPASAESLVKALDHLFTDDRRSERVRDGVTIAGSYSWERTAARFLQIIARLSS